MLSVAGKGWQTIKNPLSAGVAREGAVERYEEVGEI